MGFCLTNGSSSWRFAISHEFVIRCDKLISSSAKTTPRLSNLAGKQTKSPASYLDIGFTISTQCIPCSALDFGSLPSPFSLLPIGSDGSHYGQLTCLSLCRFYSPCYHRSRAACFASTATSWIENHKYSPKERARMLLLYYSLKSLDRSLRVFWTFYMIGNYLQL